MFAVPGHFAHKGGDGGKNQDEEGTVALRVVVLDGNEERRVRETLTGIVVVVEVDRG